MKTLIADQSLQTLLIQTHELAEIRDSQGNVLGFFFPAESKKLLPIKAVPGKAYSTREVFEHLKKLPCDVESQTDLDKHIKELRARDECDIR